MEKEQEVQKEKKETDKTHCWRFTFLAIQGRGRERGQGQEQRRGQEQGEGGPSPGGGAEGSRIDSWMDGGTIPGLHVRTTRCMEPAAFDIWVVEHKQILVVQTTQKTKQGFNGTAH